MKSFSVRPLTRLAEKIYMMLYMEESEGLMAQEDIYNMDHARSRDISRARRGVQRDCPSTPYQHFLYIKYLSYFNENSSI